MMRFLMSLFVASVAQAQLGLYTFPWADTGCAEGFDFCGRLNLCRRGRNQIGYSVPGGPCTSPGPMFRLRAGVRYQVDFANTVSTLSNRNPSNVHTHGLHISGDGNADDVTRHVGDLGSGYCLRYNWTLPPDHHGGTFWYHAHYHGNTEEQVTQGAYGPLVVEDNFIPPTLEIAAWLRNELYLQIAMRSDGSVATNGQLGPLLVPLIANEWYRVRISMVNPDAASQVLFFNQGCEVLAVASDSVNYFTIPKVHNNSYYLTGASRLDVALRCSSGNYDLWYIRNRNVAVRFEARNGLPTSASPFLDGQRWSPPRPAYLQDLLGLDVLAANRFTVTVDNNDMDGVKFVHGTPQLRNLPVNQVFEITWRGVSDHPLHFHVNHMQIVRGCGWGHPAGDMYDLVFTSDSRADECVVRVATWDLNGRYIFHCHILKHEDAGAMGWFKITGGADQSKIDVEQFVCPPLGYDMYNSTIKKVEDTFDESPEGYAFMQALDKQAAEKMNMIAP